MALYEATGTCSKGGKANKYVKKVEAANEKMAKEKVFSLLGSEQKVNRIHIKIDTLKVTK
jgi:ribosomal protein L20A (L18A)